MRLLAEVSVDKENSGDGNAGDDGARGHECDAIIEPIIHRKSSV